MPWMCVTSPWKMDDRNLPPVCVMGAGWALQKEQCWRWRRRSREVWMLSSRAESYEGFSFLLLTAKPAKKARGAPSSNSHHGENWEFPPSYHWSSGIQNGGRGVCVCSFAFASASLKWREARKSIGEGWQHQSVAWFCIWLPGMGAGRRWRQAWRELGILSCGDLESIYF